MRNTDTFQKLILMDSAQLESEIEKLKSTISRYKKRIKEAEAKIKLMEKLIEADRDSRPSASSYSSYAGSSDSYLQYGKEV